MSQQSEVEIFEHQGHQVSVTLVQQENEAWLVGVEVAGKRAATTNTPFKDKSEAQNYGRAIARAEIATRY